MKFFLEGGEQERLSISIDRVTDNRMPHFAGMNADLVRTSGEDLELQQGISWEPIHQAVFRMRLFAISVNDHGAILGRMFGDGRFDAAGSLGRTTHYKSQIELFGGSLFELGGEILLRFGCAGKNDQSTCIPIDSMHGKNGAVLFDQPGFEGFLFAETVGNRQHTRWFIDGHPVCLFSQHPIAGAIPVDVTFLFQNISDLEFLFQ